jgi:hypothetical protein
MRAAALALIGMFTAGSAIARAAERGLSPIRLHYERGPGAEACPDEGQFREAVATRLGSDPFSNHGKRLLQITIGPQAEGLQARIGLVGENGVMSGQRDLQSKSPECHDLAAVLVLTTTMALDPVGPALESPRAMPSDVTQSPVHPHEIGAVAATSAASSDKGSSSGGLELGLIVAGDVGSVSSPSLGLALGFGYAWTVFSLTLEAEAILPVHEALSTGSVASSQFTGSLVPCLTSWHLGACGLISAGATRVAASGIDPPGVHALPFFGVGARIYGALPLGDWLEGRLLVDLLVPLTQTSIVLNDTATWTAPPVSGSVGLAFVARFR